MASNYPRGVPNPEIHGWISAVGAAAPNLERAEQIGSVCKLIGRPHRFTDADGAENEIIAATTGSRQTSCPPVEQFAWVEGRSKNDGGIWDVAFTLKGCIDGKTIIDWEIETYNPYFGCSVQYLEWWDKAICIIYREKHVMIAARVSEGNIVRLRNIEDQWVSSKNHIFYRGAYDAGLVEIVEMPTLQRKQPAPESILVDRPDEFTPLAEIQDRDRFISKLKDIFTFDASDLEADLMIGSLLYPFWLSWPPIVDRYASSRRWNEPVWLPLYWYLSRTRTAREDFIAFLERLIVAPIISDDPYMTHPQIHLQEKAKALVDACRNEKLPDNTWCAFWVDWSVAEFEQQLMDFPAGFREAFSQLKRQKDRWAAIGRIR